MPVEVPSLFTAGALAKDLGVSDTRLKKAIQDLKLEAAARKGCCSNYTAEDRQKLKAALG